MSENQQEQLLKLLEEERDEYLQKVKSLTETINIIRAKLGMSSENPSIPQSEKANESSSDPDYDPKWSLKKKVVYFLKREQRFLHNREMSEMAHKLEQKISATDFTKKFSSILSMLKRDGQLTNVVVNDINRNTFWGSPKWLNEDGTIKEENMYNDEYLIESVKKDKIDI